MAAVVVVVLALLLAVLLGAVVAGMDSSSLVGLEVPFQVGPLEKRDKIL